MTKILFSAFVLALFAGAPEFANAAEKKPEKAPAAKKAEPAKAPPEPAKAPEKKPPEKKPDAKKAAALPTLIVFNIEIEKGIEPGVAKLLTELVIDQTTQLKRHVVIGQKDLDKMMAWEQNKQLQGCTDTSCLIQIAGAMGASFYVEGSVGALGDEYVVTLKLMDTEKVVVIERGTQRVSKSEKVLADTIDRLVKTLFHIPTVTADVGAARAQRGPPGVLHAAQPAVDYTLWRNVTLISGGAVAAIGAVFTVMAVNANSDYESSAGKTTHDDLDSKLGTYNALAVTGYGLGGALIATGATLWILAETGNPSVGSVRATPNRGGGTERGPTVRVLIPYVTPSGELGFGIGGVW
ncbi:MAG: hypothetical protein HY897_09095 [Deltaproteobacteria bacterium]|nr:hypothetical protein [Deltaproteobacteria bacterium]